MDSFPMEDINPRKPADTPKILFDSFKIIISRWKFVLMFSVACALCTAIIALLIPNRYTSTATLIPSINDLKGGARFSQFEGLPDMAGLGSNLFEKSPLLIYNEILKSRLIAEKVIAKEYTYSQKDNSRTTDLYQYFDTDNSDIAFKKLQDISQIDYNKRSNLISIAVTTRYPDLSSQIANYYHQCLDDFNIFQLKTSAGNNREFIENRIAETRIELRQAEDSLSAFRSKNLNYYRSTDPELLMMHDRLLRDVEVKKSKYLTLVQQYEYAVIMEKKETPIIQVLDIARPPSVKSGPARAKTTLLGFWAGFLFASLIAIWTHKINGGNHKVVVNEYMSKLKAFSVQGAGKR